MCSNLLKGDITEEGNTTILLQVVKRYMKISQDEFKDNFQISECHINICL
jgi:hypothetical protein